MAGHRCPIIHRIHPKAHVDVRNGQLHAIKATWRLSRRLVHALMFELISTFNHLQPQKQSLRRL